MIKRDNFYNYSRLNVKGILFFTDINEIYTCISLLFTAVYDMEQMIRIRKNIYIFMYWGYKLIKVLSIADYDIFLSLRQFSNSIS